MIRVRCNIADVVGAYLPQLRQRGTTFKCNCPFHEEKTPSFTVNEARQIFHCFGCGAGGDVFRFVMDFEKVDFVTAVKMLADRAGVEIIYEDGVSERSGDKDALYKIHRAAAAFYHDFLLNRPEGEEARRYLKERDLTDEAAGQFQIGCAPPEWDELIKHLAKKGFDAEQLEAAGLVVPTERNGRKSCYDRFRNRLMFPICDALGRVIGFSGRIMNQAEKGAKYVNSPETLLFHKSRVLFLFDKARKAIVDARQAVVVEGQIDAIRCHLNGLQNVVASQGTALTENHARLIQRYADEVVLVLDADTAGVKAALASSELFTAADLSVRVVTLPEKEDPDSLIRKKGGAALAELLQTAPAAIDFLIRHVGAQEDISTEVGRMRTVKAALQLIGACKTATRREAMLQRAAELLELSPQALRQDLMQERRYAAPPRQESVAPPVRVTKTYPPEEIGLLELLVYYRGEVLELIQHYLMLDCLVDPLCKTLVRMLVQRPAECLTEEFHGFDDETQRLVSRIQVDEARALDAETTSIELAQNYIMLMWKRHIERALVTLQKRADLSAEERFRLVTKKRHDLHVIGEGWASAKDLIGTLKLLDETNA